MYTTYFCFKTIIGLELIELFGYVCALIIGLVLGLIGGGGSILTVPVLVYLLGINPVSATAYSLFLVGTTSAVGAIKNARLGFIDGKTGVIFSIPAFIAVYLTRAYLVPAIPETLGHWGSLVITKDMAIMLFFAVIMLLAAISMIRNKTKPKTTAEQTQIQIPMVVLEGTVVGVITGLVGAGGGFLIIPALVLLARLEVKTAIATSLMIIAIKSLIGFLGDVQNSEIDWGFLLPFTLLSVMGIFIGLRFNQKIPSATLKKIFGWFVLIMGIGILWKELVS